jgi:hypothetical protein
MNDNRYDIAITIASTSIHGLQIVVLGICATTDYTHSCWLVQCKELNSRMLSIMKNLELSYNKTLTHIKSNSYQFLYPHTAKVKDFGTNLVELMQYSIFLKYGVEITYIIGYGGMDKSSLLLTR